MNLTSVELSDKQVRWLDEHGVTSIMPLAGDASARKYFRAMMDEKSVIVCQDDSSENIESFVFWQKTFHHLGVFVPKVFYYQPDLGVLVIADLGRIQLSQHLAQLEKDNKTHLEEERVLKILEIFLKSTKASTAVFDHAKYQYEWNHSRTYFFASYLGCSSNLLEDIDEFMQQLHSELLSFPFTLSHRDFHSKNILVFQGEFYTIDFQDAMMAPATYDLCSFLEDPYYGLSVEFKQRMKNDFFPLLKKHNIFQGDEHEYNRMYNITAIQRLIKALGTFSGQFYLRNRLGYLQYISLSVTNLRELMRLSGFWNLQNPVCHAISEYYYGQK